MLERMSMQLVQGRPGWPQPTLSHGRQPASSRRTFTRSYNGSGPGSTNGGADAFYYGRAFVQTLGERAGAALGDFLSEVGRRDAERRQAFREFQEEVEERARREAAGAQTTGAELPPTAGPSAAAWSDGPAYDTYPSPTTAGAARSISAANGGARQFAGNGARQFGANGARAAPVMAPPPDLQATVNRLQEEMAATRAAVQRFKAATEAQPAQTAEAVTPTTPPPLPPAPISD